MKIKKYFAADMRQALNLARLKQGPDVVILGNRKVLGGAELLAAEDYDETLFIQENTNSNIEQKSSSVVQNSVDSTGNKEIVEDYLARTKLAAGKEKIWTREPSLDLIQQEINSIRKLLEQQMSSLTWGDVGRKHPLWAGLLRKLGDLGICPVIARMIVEQIPENYELEQAWRTTLALLSYRISILSDSILSHNNIIAFVGASGTGKTTIIVKLATNYILENGTSSIILATLGSYRVGGREQLSSYAKIIGITLQMIHNKNDISDLLDQFYGCKLILIDTAGLSP